VRLDSPFVLAFAGTLAIHTFLLIGADAMVVIYPRPPAEIAPRVELVEVEVPPVVKPPPPPVAKPPEPKPDPVPVPEAPKQPTIRAAAPRETTPPPPPSAEPPPPTDPDPGGAPTVSMPDIAPAATGVAVGTGPRNTGPIGRGGSGGGTGSGTGQGSGGDSLPIPVSVATIKTLAVAKGDYGYIDAGKDYPAEARRLAIEGALRVRLLVDTTGKVKSAVLLNKLGHGLDELALSKARQMEFEPARDTNDRAVSSTLVWTFNMTLPK
jgi:protein TonB